MTLNIKLKGMSKIIQVSGKSYKEGTKGGLRVENDEGKAIAVFHKSEIAGWWIEPESKLSQDDLKSAEESVGKVQSINAK